MNCGTRRTLRIVGWAVLATLPCALATALWHPRAPAWSRAALAEGVISPAAATALAGALWLDARERDAFEGGHVAGALLLNETEWERLLPEVLAVWNPGTPLIVYCGNDECPAARRVRQRLIAELSLPATEVFFLEGGWELWNAQRAAN